MFNLRPAKYERPKAESLRAFVARQEQSRLNQAENVLRYIFVNGIAGVIAQRQYEPRSYANNYNVHGADGKFAKA